MAKKFTGVINIDVRDSVPDWTPFRESPAPEGAPNVLVVLYDDTGLAAWSPYGGRINMPTMQKLADNGLTYTQWHTTALCSPTRSCLLTGRNHHQNGFAQIAEGARASRATPDTSRWRTRPSARCSARTATTPSGSARTTTCRSTSGRWAPPAATGRWPAGSTATTASSAARPTTGTRRSPRTTTTSTSRTSRRRATTSRRTWPTRRSRTSRDSKTSAPKKPWYLWFCPGANHAPHHAPEEYIAKYQGKFDDGYEAYREWVLPRMVERGILPEGTGLTASTRCPRAAQPPDHVRPWDTCRTRRRGSSPAWPRCTPGSPSTPTPRSAGSSTTSRRPASSRTPSSCTAPTTARRARAARTARSTRTSSSTPTPRTSSRTCRCSTSSARPATYNHYPTGGRRRSRRRSRCSSATPTRAASPTRW